MLHFAKACSQAAWLCHLDTRQLLVIGETLLPSFDHGVGDPVPDGVRVMAQNKIVLVEGNYLLLGMPKHTSKAYDNVMLILAKLTELCLIMQTLHHGLSWSVSSMRHGMWTVTLIPQWKGFFSAK